MGAVHDRPGTKERRGLPLATIDGGGAATAGRTAAAKARVTPFADWKIWPNTLRAHQLLRLRRASPSQLKKAMFEAIYENGENVAIRRRVRLVPCGNQPVSYVRLWVRRVDDNGAPGCISAQPGLGSGRRRRRRRVLDAPAQQGAPRVRPGIAARGPRRAVFVERPGA